MYFAKRISLYKVFGLFVWGAILYVGGFTMMKDALLSPWAIILLFNLLIIFVLLTFFLVSITTLGNSIFKKLHWHVSNSMHDVFLQFTVWLIAFCTVNVILLMLWAYFSVVIRLQIAGLIYLMWRQKSFVTHLYNTTEIFIQSIHDILAKLPWIRILYYTLIIVTCVYIYMGMNLAYIPYPTAWDANHAYIFTPRAWAIHNGIYWGTSWLTSMPYLWYGFLTFWFKFAQSFPFGDGVFWISADSLTIMMNFLSGPLVLFASWFLLHSFISYLQHKKESEADTTYTMAILCIWWFLMLLWLTSGMGAFLIFVDNKTDLAVMFFGVIALYVGIQFMRTLTDTTKDMHQNKATIVQYAILAWLFFAASILAKPTWMFDMIHFGVLFLLQWQVMLFGVWAYIAILWFLWKTNLLLIYQFITPTQSNYLLGIGIIMAVIWLILSHKKYSYRHYIRYFWIWVLTIVTTLVLYKWPYTIIQQFKTTGTINIQQTIRSIILWKHTDSGHKTPILLASNTSLETLNTIDEQTTSINTWTITTATILSKEQCVAQKPDTATLYTNLKKVPADGGSEDLGRYVWYWWKGFNSFPVLWLLPVWCYSIYTDAQFLCMQYWTIQKGDMTSIMEVLSQAPQNDRIIWWQKDLENVKDDAFARQTIIKKITTYIESNAILRQDKLTYVPYKLLVPFNVTFNWSLQNLSSYYTDIGILWLLWLWLVMIGLVYGLLFRKKPLVAISLITLWAWATWWVIASAIIWYSLWLIVWTILWTIAYFYYVFQDNKKENNSLLNTILLYAIAILFVLWSVIQLILNLVRIASQGGGGPFVRYKSNVWQVSVINEQLTAELKNEIWYGSDEVFNLQFPHYNAFLTAVNQRKEGEWVIVAGTYSQYFIDNQRNVSPDWFLTSFWETASDNNVCNTYLRLKDKNTKYIAIDPNIASVVMWGWNSTLLDRFLWVIWEDKYLAQYGTLTMLQALVQNNYLKLFSTNNIVTKYAFTATDEQLSTLLKVPVGELLLIERAKMSSARYFPNAQTYATISAELFASRMRTYDAIQDIADIVGKQIRSDKVVPLAKRIALWVKQEEVTEIQALMKEITNDERFVLQQFISLVQAQTQNATQFRQYVNGLIAQSVNNGSQIIVLTVE